MSNDFSEQAITDQERLRSLYNKALDKVILRYFEQEWEYKMASGEDLGTDFHYMAYQACQTARKYNKEKPCFDYYWLTCTVSERLGAGLQQLKKKIEKAVTKKCITRYIYSFEWTKENSPHVHCLLQINDISDSKFRANWRNTFKDVGHTDIKSCLTERVNDKILYLQGVKWDEDKQSMIDNDKEQRLRFELEPLYIGGSWADFSEEGELAHLDAPPSV